MIVLWKEMWSIWSKKKAKVERIQDRGEWFESPQDYQIERTILSKEVMEVNWMKVCKLFFSENSSKRLVRLLVQKVKSASNKQHGNKNVDPEHNIHIQGEGFRSCLSWARRKWKNWILTPLVKISMNHETLEHDHCHDSVALQPMSTARCRVDRCLLPVSSGNEDDGNQCASDKFASETDECKENPKNRIADDVFITNSRSPSGDSTGLSATASPWHDDTRVDCTYVHLILECPNRCQDFKTFLSKRPQFSVTRFIRKNADPSESGSLLKPIPFLLGLTNHKCGGKSLDLVGSVSFT